LNETIDFAILAVMDETGAVLGASRGLLQRHRAGELSEAFAQRLLADFLAVSVAPASVRLVASAPMCCAREPVRVSHVILLVPGQSCWRSGLRYRLVLIDGGIALLRRQVGLPSAATADDLIATRGYGPTDPDPTV
jgi:hypothetical protein